MKHHLQENENFLSFPAALWTAVSAPFQGCKCLLSEDSNVVGFFQCLLSSVSIKDPGVCFTRPHWKMFLEQLQTWVVISSSYFLHLKEHRKKKKKCKRNPLNKDKGEGRGHYVDYWGLSADTSRGKGLILTLPLPEVLQSWVLF